MKSRGQIPFSKPKGTKKLYFSRQDLEEHINKGKHKTISEIESDATDYLQTPKKR
jgi:hypothetical protein